MKNLILIRHAKSSWDEPLQDKHRILTNKGKNDANLVASEYLKYLPNKFIVYSSPAKRAKDTALIFAQNLSFPEECIIFEDKLYTFSGLELEKIIKSISDDYENVILFGHNGAITNFVNKFGDKLIDNVPTSGVVSIEFETNNWKTIAKGKTKHVLFPRHLKL